MRAARWFGLLALVAVQVGAASAAEGQRVERMRGTLAAGSDTSADPPRGLHSFTSAAGQRVEVRVRADSFDTVLEVTSPQGDLLTNDDADDGTNSRVATYGSRAGEWRVEVTAYDARGGDYEVEVTLGAIGTVHELPGGELGESDSISVKGQRFESTTVRIPAPAEITAEMHAADFVPSLILVSPSGERFSGEGIDGVATVEVPFAEEGTWTVVASHSSIDEPGGSYTLRVFESRATGTSQNIPGTLQASDSVDLRGEHFDIHTVTGTEGRPLRLELSSTDFDAYLAARSPSGTWFRDDDGAGSGSDARLELPAEAGEWTVIVTSFAAGEMGRYQLRVLH